MTMHYDAWLESPYYDSDSEDYEEQRDILISEYMTKNTKELDLNTLCDTLSEISIDNFKIIAEHFEDKNFDYFGRKIYALYLETIEDRAREYAEDNLDL